MASEDEQQSNIVNVRIMRGVDLNSNSRLGPPGSWQATTNLFSYLRGILQLRLGSIVVANTINAAPFPSASSNQLGLSPITVTGPSIAAVGLSSSTKGVQSPLSQVMGSIAASNNNLVSNTITAPADTAVASAPKTISAITTNDKTWPGATQPIATKSSGIIPTTARNQVWQVKTTGTSGGSQPVWPSAPAVGDTVNDGTAVWQFAGGSNHGSSKIAALYKAYFPSSNTTYLVGAMASPNGDYLFYVDANNNIQPINSNGCITSKNGNWQLFPLYTGAGTSIVADGAYPIVAVNGVNTPMALTAQFSAASPNVTPPFTLSSAVLTVKNDTSESLLSANCAHVYGNQVVWGGPRLLLSTGFVGYYDNYLMFNDPASPKAGGVINTNVFLAGDATVGAYTVQVGENSSEPVTAVVGSPALTDGFGAQGQLIAWTGFKTVVYNGPIPSSGNPLPPTFGLAAVGETGTWSPKSVQRTSHGTVFLGSDGLVYLVALDNRIVVIGRALEPILAGQSPLYYSNICAYYYKGFYHLFFPQNANSNINQVEYVCDLRYLNLRDPHDAGIPWFGPFTGRYVNCVHVGKSMLSQPTVYAGLSHLPAILQLEAPNVYTDPPMNDLNGPPVNYQWGAVTGPMDLGDAHLDKIITAFSLGVGVANTTSIYAGVAAFSDISGQGSGYYDTKTVTPPASTLGNFILGTALTSDQSDFSLPTWQPGNKIRGRAFQLSFISTPTTAGPVRLSDLEFRLMTVIRRPTDSG